jgi:hypothetical protein
MTEHTPELSPLRLLNCLSRRGKLETDVRYGIIPGCADPGQVRGATYTRGGGAGRSDVMLYCQGAAW